MVDVADWIDNGPPCLYCGGRVAKEDFQVILDPDGEGVIFNGMCKSETCRKLPPRGNPFMFMVSKECVECT